MIVVFDAQCLLCNGWGRFLVKHDRKSKYQFASIQGATGRALLAAAGLPVTGPETLLVVDGERSWQHTAAILRVLHGLGWPWPHIDGMPSSVRAAIASWRSCAAH